MGVAVQKFSVFHSNILKELVPSKSRAMTEALAIGQDIIDLSRERTARGKGRNDRSLPGYSPNYVKQKRNFISGKGGRRGSTTEWKATKVSDYGRLTGQLYSSYTVMRPTVRVSQNAADLIVDVGVRSAKMAKRLGYLKGKGFDILGVSDAGSSAGQRERRYLAARSKARLGLNKSSRSSAVNV